MPGRGTGISCGLAAAAFVAAFAVHCGGALLPLSAYQTIIDRKPFGDLAKPRPKEKGATPEEVQAAQAEAQMEKAQQTLAKQVDLVAVNITLRGGVSVGFIDKSVKPPRSIYLGVGETESGYTVESADFAAETATISKDGVRITLKLGSGMVSQSAAPPQDGEEAAGSGAPAPTVENAAAPGASPVARQARSSPIRPVMRPGIGYRNTVLERKRAEEAEAVEADRRRRAESAALAKEAADASAERREHDMNFRLLLEGKEPVSEIQLTPEEEAELVKRGLLESGEH